MKRFERLGWCAAVMVASAGCDARLPDVDPTLFACTGDRALDDGTLPCPASHSCFEQQCTRRWLCDDRNDDLPGCRPDTTRCEPEFNALTSATRCVSGVHTSTTTVPEPATGCDCPDGLYCVALAGDDPSAYPLYLLPDGGPVPDALGADEAEPAFRRCVRACSGEVNCPPDHSCRPAAVTNDALLSGGEGDRNTIGVCYPNTLVDTSTSTRPPQPDPRACRQTADCAGSTMGQICRAALVTLVDHPEYPAGAARTETDQIAVVTRCEPAQAGLGQPGTGCTRSPDCASGVCFDGRCQTLCDPQDPITACTSNSCRATTIDRTLPNGMMSVSDEVFLCR